MITSDDPHNGLYSLLMRSHDAGSVNCAVICYPAATLQPWNISPLMNVVGLTVTLDTVYCIPSSCVLTKAHKYTNPFCGMFGT